MDQAHLKKEIFSQLQLVNKDLYAKFEYCVGNSPSRTDILRYLSDHEKATQSSLQKELNIDRAAITRHLKQLEASGIVQRSKEEKDQRVTWVQLTPAAKETMENLFKQRNRFVNETLVDFSYEQLIMFHEMLNTMRKNISKATKL